MTDYKTANKNVLTKYSWYLKAKNIDNKFTKKLNEAIVCIILFKTSLCCKILICAKYLLADLSFLEIFLFINSSWIFLIRDESELYLFPKLTIIRGIAGNNIAGSKIKLSIKILYPSVSLI